MNINEVLRGHGLGGGKGAYVEFVKITYSLTEPTNPSLNEIWIKHEGNVNNLYFDDTEPLVTDNDIFAKVIHREQIAKATEIKKGNTTLNVVAETLPDKNLIAKTDYFDVYGNLGLMRVYSNGEGTILNAYQWNGTSWGQFSTDTSEIMVWKSSNPYSIGKYTIDVSSRYYLVEVTMTPFDRLELNPITNKFYGTRGGTPYGYEFDYLTGSHIQTITLLDTSHQMRDMVIRTDGGMVWGATDSPCLGILKADGTKASTNFGNSTVTVRTVDTDDGEFLFGGSNVPRAYNHVTNSSLYKSTTGLGSLARDVSYSPFDNKVWYSGWNNGTSIAERFSFDNNGLYDDLAIPHPTEIAGQICFSIEADESDGSIVFLGGAVNTEEVWLYKYDINGNQINKHKLFNLYSYGASIGYSNYGKTDLKITQSHVICSPRNTGITYVFDRKTLSFIYAIPTTIDGFANNDITYAVYPSKHFKTYW